MTIAGGYWIRLPQITKKEREKERLIMARAFHKYPAGHPERIKAMERWEEIKKIHVRGG